MYGLRLQDGLSKWINMDCIWHVRTFRETVHGPGRTENLSFTRALSFSFVDAMPMPPPCSLQGPARHLQRRIEGLLMTAGDGVLPFKVQMAADGQIRNSVSRGSGKSNREALTHSVDFCCKYRTHRQCVCINSLHLT